MLGLHIASTVTQAITIGLSHHSTLADLHDHKFYKQDQRGCWATLNSHHAHMVMSCVIFLSLLGVQ